MRRLAVVYGNRAEECLLMFFFQAEDGIREADVTGVQTCALPIFAVALDAKMVVVLPCQFAVSGCRFQNTLGQGNGGGYAGFFHTSYGPVLISIDVLLAGDALGPKRPCGKKQQEAECGEAEKRGLVHVSCFRKGY